MALTKSGFVVVGLSACSYVYGKRAWYGRESCRSKRSVEQCCSKRSGEMRRRRRKRKMQTRTNDAVEVLVNLNILCSKSPFLFVSQSVLISQACLRTRVFFVPGGQQSAQCRQSSRRLHHQVIDDHRTTSADTQRDKAHPVSVLIVPRGRHQSLHAVLSSGRQGVVLSA